MTGTAKVEIAGKAAVVEQEGRSVRVLLHEGETLYAARDILKACGTKYPEKWCAREFRDQTRVRMLKLLYPARGKTGGMNRRTYEMYFTDEAGGLTILEMIGCDNGVRDWLKTEVFPYKLSRPGAQRAEKIHEPPIYPPASDGMKDRLEYVNNQIDAMLFALLELKKYIAQPNA